MKIAGIMQRVLKNVFLSIIAGFFVSSCGLEVVYSIEAPTETYNEPLYSSDDPLKWYFSFKTAPASSEKNLVFTGTDIYYKIYSNYSNLNSHKSSILSVNTESNGYSAATKMIETYTYKPLGISNSSENAVFCEGHDNTRFLIRLKKYQDGIDVTGLDDEDELKQSQYSQNACVGYYKDKDSTSYTYESYIPMRNGNSKSFDFFDYDEDDKYGSRDVEPKEGDTDYYYNATFSEENCYYVQMFAVARAWNSSAVSPIYSLVLDLGSVPIRKGQ